MWQLEPRQFSLRNREWEAFIAGIVETVKEQLGIGEKVEASLYKLLIYEPGSFFAPHRDTEKTAGMFATLVVALPARHQGGALLITHDGLTERIEFAGDQAEFQTQFAAFYADCQHEITPVTKGYRVCLVYNLAIPKRKRQPTAPRHSGEVERISELLTRIFAERSLDLDRLAIPLAHQYTEASFGPLALKGADRTRADVVLRAAQNLGYRAYLALLTHYQSGTPDYSSYSPSWSRRRRRWSDDYGDEDEDENEADSAAMEEVFDEHRTLNQWYDAAGCPQPFGEMGVDEKEILGGQGGTLKQSIHEATGNEGATLERWYRQGVIVLWPRDRHFRILAGEGQQSAIPELAKMIDDAADPAADPDCRELAEQIIQRWQAPEYYPRQRKSLAGELLKLLDRLQAEDLVQQFVRDVLPRDYDGSEGKPLARICGRLGWKPFAKPLAGFFAKQMPEKHCPDLAAAMAIFEGLCCEKPAMTDARREALESASEEVETLIARFDAYKSNSWYTANEGRAGVPELILRAWDALAHTERLDRLVSHLLANPTRYGLHEVLIPAVKAIHVWVVDESPANAAYQRLREHCLAELRLLTASPIEPPKDWTRDADLGCTCLDCKALVKFLKNPEQKEARFPLRKDRRQHLHQQIDAQEIDLTHATDRRGSPQTLVCTKTQASYERRLAQYEVDCRLLKELHAIAASPPRRAGAPPRVKKKPKPKAKSARR